MKRLKGHFALLVAVLFLLPALTGCELYDKLKARDHLNKGVSAYSKERWDEAIAEFQSSVELDPELIDAYLYLAAAFRAQFIPHFPEPENLERAERAIRTFKQVLEMDPTNINAMANIAGLYDGMDEQGMAKEWYRKRIEIEPNNHEPYYGIGTIDWQLVHNQTGMQGDNVGNLSEEQRLEVAQTVDEGVEALQKALELNENYSDAMQYLNLLYRERAYLAQDEEEKRNWQKEADKLALQALELKRFQEEEEERRRRSFGAGAERP